MPDNDNTNVVVLDVETSLDLPLERVLDGARKHELEDCMIVGWAFGKRFYMAGQTCDSGKMLVLLERARLLILKRLEGNDE